MSELNSETMSEEEIYKMLLVEKLDKFPLLNELFAIRDSRGKRNDYTIFVNGYISLDVINKAVEKVNLLDNLKEIEKLHQEENGKLRVELEQEKEKNNTLEKHQKQYLDGELITAKQGKFFEKMIKENYIRKDKIKEIYNILGEYRHFSTPTNEQIEQNENAVDKAVNFIKELLEKDDEI